MPYLAKEPRIGSGTRSISLFGGMRVHTPDGAQVQFTTRRAAQALIFLSLKAHDWVAREELATVLWPDADTEPGRHKLDTELWRLRDMLRKVDEDPKAWIECRAGALRIAPRPDIAVDVAHFNQLLDSAKRQADAAAKLSLLHAAAELYAGDVCPEDRSEWLEIERESLRSRYISCLEQLLAAASAARKWDEVKRIAQELLARDPLLEHVHRALMTAHHALGDRGKIIAQYRTLCRILDEELGVAPLGETTSLYFELSGASAASDKPLVGRVPAGQHQPTQSDSLGQKMREIAHQLLALAHAFDR
jgi:LuxR family maltose regulon positive regulatory protein